MEKLRADMLVKIHSGHQGVIKSCQCASENIWWPGISKDIEIFVKSCTHCSVVRPSQIYEPLILTPLPQNPWDKVGVDSFDYKNKKYMVVIDYFSRYFEIVELYSTTASVIIGKLKGILVRYGLCIEMMTDNVPPFNSKEFENFANEYGFTHKFSSPYFAQSNGAAERGVQSAKKVLAAPNPYVYLALLAYHTTAHSATGYSPAHLSMGRKLRTTLPTINADLTAPPDLNAIRHNDKSAKLQNKVYYDWRHCAKLLPPLNPGDVVRVKLDHEKNWSTTADVKTKYSSDVYPRSYVIITDQGEFRRNRKHLQLITPRKILSPDYSDTSVSVVPEPPDKCDSTPSLVNGSTCTPMKSSFGRTIKPVRKLDL